MLNMTCEGTAIQSHSPFDFIAFLSFLEGSENLTYIKRHEICVCDTAESIEFPACAVELDPFLEVFETAESIVSEDVWMAWIGKVDASESRHQPGD